MTKKKIIRGLLPVLLTLLAGGVMYYYAPPALSIYDASAWWFVILLLGIYGGLKLLFGLRTLSVEGHMNAKGIVPYFGAALVLFVLYMGLQFFSAPIFHAAKYAEAGAQRITTGDFASEISPVQDGKITDIAIMDTVTASAMGKRQIGSLGTLATQYELGQFMTTTVNGQAKKVATLGYGGFWKWLNRRNEGIPGYVSVDPVSGNSEYIEFKRPIHYSDTSYFNENITRHLHFSAPTAYFDNVHFEVDNDENPYWVATTYSFHVLLDCPVPNGVLICDAVTGETVRYGLSDLPEWVSIVFPADDMIRLVNYAGLYGGGYWNSRLAKTGVYTCTNDYGYKVVGENLNAFTGITSAASDESNIAFILCDEHTGQVRRYDIYGAEEYSAETAAEGLVMNYGYRASFPSLVNVGGEPVYVMALVDDGALIKKYAMVDLQDYTKVVAADTIEDTWKQFVTRYGTSGEKAELSDESVTVRLTSPVETAVINGDSYAYLKGEKGIYRITVNGNEEVLFLTEGERVKLTVYESLRDGVYDAALEK